MISGIVSRSSAAFLGGAGLALLFAPDVVLRALIPGMPAQAYWLGQLLAAAWLGVASLNWMQRGAVIGGIYARPLVSANVVLYVVSSMSLGRVVLAPGAGWSIRVPAVGMYVFAAIYVALMFRGPFDPLDTKAGGAR